MSKSLILLLFLPIFLNLTSPHLLPAQEPISTTVVGQRFQVTYDPTGKEYNRAGNKIIIEIAKDVLRQPRLVRLNLTYSYNLSIQVEGDKKLLHLRFYDPILQGDLNLRSFPMDDLLLPNRVILKIRWANKLDTTSYTETIFTNLLNDFGKTFTLSEPIPTFDPEVDTLMLREPVFFYDTIALNRFMDRLWLVNDYYASVAILDSLTMLSDAIRLDQIEALPLAFMQVMEFDKIIACIDSLKIPTELLNGGFDPGGFNQKYGPLFKHARSINFTFQDQLRGCGAIPWDGDIDRLAGYFTGRMLTYVQRSRLMNDIHGRIYQKYLDVWFNSSVFGNDYGVLTSLLAKMYPDARADTLVPFVSRRVLSSYRNRARELMEVGRFADAYSLMENGERFRKNNPYMTQDDNNEPILTNAANGIYSSYAAIASACLDAGKMEMAVDYLDKARAYRKEKSSYINSDSLFNAVSARLFFIRNADCDLLLDEEQFESAEACFVAIGQTFDPEQVAPIQAELNAKISRARQGILSRELNEIEQHLRRDEKREAVDRYLDAVRLGNLFTPNPNALQTLDSLAPLVAALQYEMRYQEGSDALNRRQFTMAISLFEEAKHLSSNYSLIQEPLLDSLYRQAVKQSLLIRLASNRRVIWNNQFDSAYAFLARVESTAKANDLLADADFIAARSKYLEKIGEQQCRNLNDSIEMRMIRADRWIALRDYSHAMEALQEGVNLSVSKSECSYPVRPLLDTIAKYMPAAIYQRKVIEAEHHAAAGIYSLVITDLENAAAIYQTDHLERFGLTPPGVFTFLEQRGNPQLTEYAVRYHMMKGDYQSAMRFLQLMCRQDYPGKGALDLQTELGIALAKEDFKTHQSVDALQTQLVKYTADQSWYRTFEEAYKKEWKRLEKLSLEQ